MNEPDVDAMRRSLITVRTNPPPAATPFTALMIGLGTDSNHVNIPGTSSDLGRVDEPAAAVCCSTLASSPEQNPRPAPVMTMPTTRGSRAASSTASRNAASIENVSAFNVSGRFRVIVATGSSTSNRISLIRHPSLPATLAPPMPMMPDRR